MPIKDKSAYPPNWKTVSQDIKRAQGMRCAWCPADQGCPHPITGSMVVLTTAHIDHDPSNNARENLAALCQKCHLAHDLKQHMQSRAKTRREKKRNKELFQEGDI